MKPTSYQTCTVCGASFQSKRLYRKSLGGRGSVIEIHRCKDPGCRTVFLGNSSAAFDDTLYEHYRKFSGLPKEEVYDPLTRKRYRMLLERFSSYLPGRAVLDVGCGKGDFVDAALAAGWHASGIDLSLPAIEIARSWGIPVSNLDFFSPQIKPSSLDLVTMFELIEHVVNPGAFLRRAEEVVKPGGLVYLTTPNFNSLDRRVLGTDWDAIHREHMNYFTQPTLVNLIRRSSRLQIVGMETRNVSAELLQRLRDSSSLKAGLKKPSTATEREAAARRDFRQEIERSPFLMSLKHLANAMLNITSLGSTIAVLLQRKEDGRFAR